MSLSHMGTVAKIVAASMGVEVVFDASADTASTDGTRIFIPTSLIGMAMRVPPSSCAASSRMRVWATSGIRI